MRRDDLHTEAAERFGAIAQKYCEIVESSSNLGKTELLARLYDVLPSLVDSAIHLPDAATWVDDPTNEQPEDSMNAHSISPADSSARYELYRSLKEKLGDADTYRMVFDATKDTAAIHCSLADDIADIYRDLKEGLVLMEKPNGAENAVWEWRFGFGSHWGHHALSALKAIHDIRNF